ncbi:RNA cytosine-C(5)-methyltransferase NSUN2 [Halotydeus destructor]|nr:RNA cytosine-C(5)-methyltransferase NSUN2 [Halotydeus destructor]
MGFKSKKRRLQRRREENGGNGDVKQDARDRKDAKPSYTDVIKENQRYENYYKAQKIVPLEDWDKFMSTLRDGLPAAFRITNYFGGQSTMLRKIVEGPAFQSLATGNETNVDGETKVNSVLTSLPWYPKKLGWQLKMSRVEIRKTESSIRLHNFLISESESGYISRQEAVSMIPPLLLDIKPHHKVLDMCAAPGSKTAQIIELLHANDEKFGQVSGVVVANDVDNKRCYMLVHQAKRLHSPCFVITNHDAGSMPKFFENQDGVRKEMKFDRILCDAPCTGDGTIRKNHDIWTNWNAANGNNFHGIQSRILKRGVELLAKDGLIVYSTCSLNPMEDESVVASVLNSAEGGLELVDVSDKLPGLKYVNGLTDWVVMTRCLREIKTVEEVDEQQRTQIRDTMFPPKNAAELNLQRCMRILPHLQDTGGFFVAVIRKTVDRLPWESANPNSASAEKEEVGGAEPPSNKRKYPRGSFKEDPFMFFKGEEPEWLEVKKFYEISDEFCPQQLMHRSSTGRMRNIYFLTASARKLIIDNEDRIKFINAGARLFARISDKEAACSYRLSQEGLPSLFNHVGKANMVTLTTKDIESLLIKDALPFEELSEDAKTTLERLGAGSCILIYRNQIDGENEELVVPIAGWKGKTTLRPYIAKNERIHFLRVCGIDTLELENETRKQFEERQERKSTRAAKIGEESSEVKTEPEVAEVDESPKINEEETESLA